MHTYIQYRHFTRTPNVIYHTLTCNIPSIYHVSIFTFQIYLFIIYQRRIVDLNISVSCIQVTKTPTVRLHHCYAIYYINGYAIPFNYSICYKRAAMLLLMSYTHFFFCSLSIHTYTCNLFCISNLCGCAMEKYYDE